MNGFLIQNTNSFYKKIIRKVLNSLYCTLCSKEINIEHQGRADTTRHINGNVDKKAQEAKRKQPGIYSIFLKPSNPLESQVRRAEVKVTGFIAEHNIPLAVADHLGPLFKNIFRDSKIAKNYACGKTKTTCILNRAIKPELQKKLINQMKKDCYSISADGSNDQGLKKMKPLTIRLFYINQHMVANQFLEMCL